MADPQHPGANRLVVVAVGVVVVAVDQVTKTWALHHASPPRHVVGPLWWWLTTNPGAAFGIGGGTTPVVVAVVALLVAGLLVFGRRASRTATLPVTVALGLVVGGAVGNLADRLFRHHHGQVIDFIDAVRIGRHDRWPIFNVADAAIVVGAVVLVIGYSMSQRSAVRTDAAT